MLCCFLILLNGPSAGKSRGVRKTVWGSQSVYLQIKMRSYCKVLTAFKTKTCLAPIKKRKGNQASPLYLRKSNFISNYNWNCIPNTYLSTVVTSSVCCQRAVTLALNPSITKFKPASMRSVYPVLPESFFMSRLYP